MAIVIVGSSGGGSSSGGSSGGGSGGGTSTIAPTSLGCEYTWHASTSAIQFLYNIVLREFSIAGGQTDVTKGTDRVECLFTCFDVSSIAANSGFVYISASNGTNKFNIRTFKNGVAMYTSPDLSYTPGTRTGFQHKLAIGAQPLAVNDVINYALVVPNLPAGSLVYSIHFPFIYIGA